MDLTLEDVRTLSIVSQAEELFGCFIDNTMNMTSLVSLGLVEVVQDIPEPFLLSGYSFYHLTPAGILLQKSLACPE